jgi:periplasmic protein TonB
VLPIRHRHHQQEQQSLEAMSELIQEPRPPWRLWTIAAIAAVSLHVAGAALALAHLNSDDGSNGLGANVASIGVELTSPAAEETELPPGPDADAVVASTALSEQKAEVKPADLPKEVPKESDEPDRIVTRNEQKKPTDDEPKTEAVQTAASLESAAQEASARRRLENAREANATTAPTVGIGRDNQKLTRDWGRRISAYFELHKRYPKTDKIRAAKVKLSLVINRMGHVLSVAVAESSGDPLFDEAALDMVRRSDPVPRPSDELKLTDDSLSFNLPVDFKGRK